MPKKAKELSATAVRNLGPGLHAVGGVAGLLLQVAETGARSWILRTMVGVKRRDIGLGGFPDVPLAMAREKARETKDLIKSGVDPVAERRAARSSIIAAQAKTISFKEAAQDWHEARAVQFRNVKHAKDWLSSLERYAFPHIGDLPIQEIEVAHILKVLKPMWEEKTETATRIRQRIEKVFDYAKAAKKFSGDNPAAWKANLKELLPDPTKVIKKNHFAALPWAEVPAFMVELRKQAGMGAKALEFAILTAARSGEVRLATWDEIDLKRRLWTIPAERMKAEKEHHVPLSEDAVKLLSSLPRMEGCDYIFPAQRGGVLSDMTISAVCRRMKVDAVPHGFRSSFKDWARNRTRFADEVSELALAHVNSDKTRAAYARDGLLEQRTQMMAKWCEFLNSPPVAKEDGMDNLVALGGRR
jgi:integrase